MAIAARTAGSPQRRNGPTQETSTSPGSSSAADGLRPVDVGGAELDPAEALGELAQAGLGAAGQHGRGTVRHQALGGQATGVSGGPEDDDRGRHRPVSTPLS